MTPLSSNEPQRKKVPGDLIDAIPPRAINFSQDTVSDAFWYNGPRLLQRTVLELTLARDQEQQKPRQERKSVKQLVHGWGILHVLKHQRADGTVIYQSADNRRLRCFKTVFPDAPINCYVYTSADSYDSWQRYGDIDSKLSSCDGRFTTVVPHGYKRRDEGKERHVHLLATALPWIDEDKLPLGEADHTAAQRQFIDALELHEWNITRVTFDRSPYNHRVQVTIESTHWRNVDKAGTKAVEHSKNFEQQFEEVQEAKRRDPQAHLQLRPDVLPSEARQKAEQLGKNPASLRNGDLHPIEFLTPEEQMALCRDWSMVHHTDPGRRTSEEEHRDKAARGDARLRLNSYNLSSNADETRQKFRGRYPWAIDSQDSSRPSRHASEDHLGFRSCFMRRKESASMAIVFNDAVFTAKAWLSRNCPEGEHGRTHEGESTSSNIRSGAGRRDDGRSLSSESSVGRGGGGRGGAHQGENGVTLKPKRPPRSAAGGGRSQPYGAKPRGDTKWDPPPPMRHSSASASASSSSASPSWPPPPKQGQAPMRLLRGP